MGLLYSVSEKELLEIRNKIFVTDGIPALYRNNFEKSPFTNHWYGKNNLGDYTYELCRLSEHSHLEIITTHISKGDSWIKIFLNIFQLNPDIKSLKNLKNIDGIQFDLPPNSITKMRLRIDDFKYMPLFNFVEHRIKFYYSKNSFNRRKEELSKLIGKDLSNIDSFVKRWHEIHKPIITTWEGNQIGKMG
jgi:hypothetical protein